MRTDCRSRSTPEAAGILFLEPRDLHVVEICQNGIRQREPRFVIAFEISPRRASAAGRAVRPTCATTSLATLETRLFAELFPLLRRERELFSFGLGQRASEFFLLRGDELCAGRWWRGRIRLAVRGVELFSQIVEIKAQVVARTVFGQHAAVAVENFSRARPGCAPCDTIASPDGFGIRARRRFAPTTSRRAKCTDRPASTIATRRSCGSFFFSSSKISMAHSR